MFADDVGIGEFVGLDGWLVRVLNGYDYVVLVQPAGVDGVADVGLGGVADGVGVGVVEGDRGEFISVGGFEDTGQLDRVHLVAVVGVAVDVGDGSEGTDFVVVTEQHATAFAGVVLACFRDHLVDDVLRDDEVHK